LIEKSWLRHFGKKASTRMSDRQAHGKALVLDDGAARLWLAYNSQDDLDALAKIFQKAKRADLHLVPPADDLAALPKLAARINAEHQAMIGAVKRGIEHALACGDLLIEAKVKVRGAGARWLPWLAANCPLISNRTARLYMQLARAKPALETKMATVADLTLQGAVKLLSVKTRPPKLHPVTISGPLAARMKVVQGDCRSVLPTITEPYIRECFPLLKDGFEEFRISDPPYNQGRPGYDDYDDSLPEDEYRNMIIQVFGGKRSVFIHYGRVIINKFGGGVLGKCMQEMPWIYNNNLPDQHRLIAWFNCQPDLSRVGQDYKNPNDARVKKRIEAGCEARGYDWYFDIVKNVSKTHDHPCPIPVELAARIIWVTTNPGDLIIDPFCGSGTIVAVAAALGRYAIGIDQSEKYCRIARARLGTIERELGLKDEAVFAEAAE
jgi:hypothetical protein